MSILHMKELGIEKANHILSKSNSNSYVNFSSLNHRFKKLLNGNWSKKM
jgi:hypothetical protein